MLPSEYVRGDLALPLRRLPITIRYSGDYTQQGRGRGLVATCECPALPYERVKRLPCDPAILSRL